MARPPAVRYQSSYRLGGRPLISVAFGASPDEGEKGGRAQGVIALGDEAKGVLAMGGRATGVFALGGRAQGVFAVGGRARGVVALGGVAVGLVAMGGAAVGLAAIGGAAVGGVALGGAAAGYLAVGGAAWGKRRFSATRETRPTQRKKGRPPTLVPLGVSEERARQMREELREDR